MPTHIQDVPDLKGKKVLLRADFNVPIINRAIGDDYRIETTLETIQYLVSQGARIRIVSHLGRKGTESLEPIFEYLKQKFTIVFSNELSGEAVTALLDQQQDGEIVLFENIRRDEREKQNDAGFAQMLASYGDIYVNDAFAVSHRAHASVVAITAYLPSYMGFQLAREIEHLSQAFNPKHPFLFALGGAKTETKLPLIEKFLPIADTIFAGGVLANDLCRAEGVEVGRDSVYSEGPLVLSAVLSATTVLRSKDLRVKRGEEFLFLQPTDILETDTVVDSAGPQTLDVLREKINGAGMILWNGPLGGYEAGYKEATLALATMIAESGAVSIVGGGDTVAAIKELNLFDKLTFVSTGGGAMLEYLANESLPGIDALK